MPSQNVCFNKKKCSCTLTRMQSSVIRSGGRKYTIDVVSSSYLLLLYMGPKYRGVMMVHHSSSTERSLCSSQRREEYTAYKELYVYYTTTTKLTIGVLQMQKYVCDIFRFSFLLLFEPCPEEFSFFFGINSKEQIYSL